MHKHSRTRGFTLIELLVVVAIIGLLASVVLASLTTARARGRDANRVSTLKQMANVIAQADSGAAVTFAGCTGALADVSTCVAPGPVLTPFKDPSTSGTPCAKNSSATCQYVIGKAADGSAGATTQDFEICTYLEAGVGTLAKGMVRMDSSDGSGIVSGCN